MKIEKDVTPNFERYQVLAIVKETLPQTWRERLFDRKRVIDFEKTLENIIEADDSTGLIVQQVTDKNGDLVFTNGLEDISFDNTAKLFLLVPIFRQAFLVSGFVPKQIRTYMDKVVIKFRGQLKPDVIIKEVVIESSKELIR